MKKDINNKKDKNNKNEKKYDKLLIILIVLLIIVSIILIVVKIINIGSLSTEDEKVVELHNYFSTADLNNCEGFFTYSDKKITYDDVNSETRICLAYQKSDIKSAEAQTYTAKKKDSTCDVDGMIFKIDDNSKDCTVTKIDRKIIDDTYKKLYGKDIENNDQFKVDSFHLCYLKDDYYYCGLSETFTYTIGSETTIYRVMEKAQKKGSSIVIYDYFARLNDNKCYSTYATEKLNDECTNNINSTIDYKYLKQYGTKYKHTFKKASDGTYYWVSSEPMNLN